MNKCKNCGGLTKNIYCSRVCYHTFRKIKGIKYKSNKLIINHKSNKFCEQCDKEYTPDKKSSRFCSMDCYWKFRRSTKEIFQIQQKERFIVKCEMCGKEYEIHKYRLKTSKYCSIECQHKAKIYPRKNFICPCGNEFEDFSHIHRKYCSSDCAAKGIKKRQSIFSNYIQKILIYLLPDYTIKNEIKLNYDTGFYYVDFLINDSVVIECFGDYWHCNPIKYNDEYFHTQIKKYAKEIWEDDHLRITRLENLNYKVIILWEFDWIKGLLNYKQLIKDIKNGI